MVTWTKEKSLGGDIVQPRATKFATNYITLNNFLEKMGWFEEIVYKWWMEITQVKSNKNWIKSGETNVRPSLLGQSGKISFIIWATVYGASTCEFRSCSHNGLCVQAYASDEREPYSSTC